MKNFANLAKPNANQNMVAMVISETHKFNVYSEFY